MDLSVSFSSRDTGLVDLLAEWLYPYGVSIRRYDTDLPYQERIDGFINGLVSSERLALLLGESYAVSEYCLVELVLAAQSPHSVILLSSAPPGSDFVSAIADGVRRLLREGCEVGWLQNIINGIDIDDAESAVDALLARRIMPFDVLRESYGLRELFGRIGYTPQLYVEELEGILDLGSLQEREAAFESYVEHAAPSAIYLVARGRSYADAGYRDLAFMRYSQALALDGDSVSAVMGLCRLVIDCLSDDVGKAASVLISGLKELAEDDLQQERAVFFHALGLAKLSEACEAGFEERKKIGLLMDARRFLEQSINLMPTSTACNALGQVLEELGDIEGSMPYYERSLELDPRNYIAWNNAALYVLRYEKNPGLAKRMYEKALEINPGYTLAKDGLALAWEKISVQEALFLDLSSAVENCSSQRPLTNAATILDEDYGEFEAAGALYRLAFEKAPDKLAPNYNYASFLRRTNAPREEIEPFLSRAESFPWNELVAFERSLLNLREGGYAEAREGFETMIARRGGSRELRYLMTLSCVLGSNGVGTIPIDDGLESYGPYLDLLARIRLQEGDAEEAERVYGLAINKIDANVLPPLSVPEKTDFHAIVRRVELDFSKASIARVRREQMVSIDSTGEAGLSIARLERMLGDMEEGKEKRD